MQEGTTLEDLREKPQSPVSTEPAPPSGSPDQDFFVSFGLIVSCRLGDVEKIRGSIQKLGGRIVFQTVSNGVLFLFRAAQVVRALQGDASALAEAHKRKERRVIR